MDQIKETIRLSSRFALNHNRAVANQYPWLAEMAVKEPAVSKLTVAAYFDALRLQSPRCGTEARILFEKVVRAYDARHCTCR